MDQIEDSCSICGTFRSRTFAFQDHVEGSGYHLCGPHAAEYQSWRADFSPNVPDIEGYVDFMKKFLLAEEKDGLKTDS